MRGVRRVTGGPCGRLVRRARGAAAEAGPGGGRAYRAVGAAQRHHELRQVLVRLLRQLEGLLNGQHALCPHGAWTRLGPTQFPVGCSPTDHWLRVHRDPAGSDPPAIQSPGRGYRPSVQITPAGEGNTARRPRELRETTGRD